MTSTELDAATIGQRIRDARVARGWTQLDLALRAGTSLGTVSRWERGKPPPVRELIRLASVLEIDVHQLVADPPGVTDPIAREILEKLDDALRRLARLEAAVADRDVPPARRSGRAGRPR